MFIEDPIILSKISFERHHEYNVLDTSKGHTLARPAPKPGMCCFVLWTLNPKSNQKWWSVELSQQASFFRQHLRVFLGAFQHFCSRGGGRTSTCWTLAESSRCWAIAGRNRCICFFFQKLRALWFSKAVKSAALRKSSSRMGQDVPRCQMGIITWIRNLYVGVSENSGTPKWMVYKGKPYQNGWFGGATIFGNTHVNDLWWPCSMFWSFITSSECGKEFLFVAGTSRWLGGVATQRRGAGDSDNHGWSKLYTSKVNPLSYQNMCVFKSLHLCRYLCIPLIRGGS